MSEAHIVNSNLSSKNKKQTHKHAAQGRSIFEQASNRRAALSAWMVPIPRVGYPRPSAENRGAWLAGGFRTRYTTNLSQQNFAIDTMFYPLGSCTMVQPSRGTQGGQYARLLGRHPLAPEAASQGHLACMYDLQEILKDVTGMQGVSLAPMAGAQGELAGVAMTRAYHEARGDDARREIPCLRRPTERIRPPL